VILRLGVTGGRCRLLVGNTGPAISETEQAGLFGRFFRAGQQEDAPGAGLGLSLARELARSHGGDVTFVGSRDGWNEFELVLPQRSANRDAPPAPKPDLAAKTG
jgi:signal transduction histidine kinase